MTDITGVDDAAQPAPLTSMRVADLQALASQYGIKGAARLRKSDLIAAIEQAREAADAQAADAPEATEPEAPVAETADVAEPAAAEPEPTAPVAAEPAPVAAEPVAAEPSEPTVDATAGTAEQDPIADVVFKDRAESRRGGRKRAAATEPASPMSLDDLVLPPARGEADDESAPAESGRRRRRVTADAQAPAENAEESESAEGDGEGDDGESRQGGRKRGRNRGRRGRGGDAESQPESGADEDDDTTDGDGDEGDAQGGRRSRSRSRGRGNDNQGGQNGPSAGSDAGQDEDGDGRRGRGRYRDRKRGRGAGDDVDPEYSPDDVLLPVAGILDVLDNYAFVRTSGYLPGPNDVYVSLGQVKKYGLRKGDAVVGAIRQPREGEQAHGRQKFNAMVKFDTINGQSTDDAQRRPTFDDLTPLYPEERLGLETAEGRLTQRAIDLFAPIGKGTRGLIVAPPKSGKSVVLQQIANAIAENSPTTHLMVVLVDERPEEITAMQRSIRGEVVASAFDLPAEDHTTIAELAIERAKRLVELGHDVVVLLDSITQLARAYNLTAPASGRILSGGVDASALYPPKRFFGAARNVENGGSLTILATAMVETGSRTDEVILEEFAGTGNMEIRLSREIADKRIFPALDIQNSGTLKEEMLLSPAEVEATWRVRRELTSGETQGSLESVLTRLAETRTNSEFIANVRQQPAGGTAARARR